VGRAGSIDLPSRCLRQRRPGGAVNRRSEASGAAVGIVVIQVRRLVVRDTTYGEFEQMLVSATTMHLNSEIPDDENGAVLRRMELSGDDLSKPRQIDFVVVLPDETRASNFAVHIRTCGYVAVVKRSDVVPELPWDVTVSNFMVPTHTGITAFESMLESAAAALGGRNDGWGCFERATSDH
jgi:hypothetical protein